MDFEKILKQYKSQLVIGNHTYAQVLKRFSDFLPLKRIAESEVNPIDLRYIKDDCAQYAVDKGIDPNRLEFLIYEVTQNDKSQKYYDEIDSTGCLHIVVEESLGYLNCESPSLFEEIDLAKGISSYDIEHKTLRLEDYLSRLLCKENRV